MKKFILPIFVALMATISFSACSDDTDEMSDDELAKEIINYGYYTDGEAGDVDQLMITASSATYVWDDQVQAQGTWTVKDKKVVITNTSEAAAMEVGATMSLTISEEGKTLKANDGTVLKNAKQ